MGAQRSLAAELPTSGLLRGREPLTDVIPVDHLEERIDVVGPFVLILQVIGVLPDVDSEDRGTAPVHERVVLVRRADDLELALARRDDPGPAAAEPAQGGLLQLLE